MTDRPIGRLIRLRFAEFFEPPHDGGGEVLTRRKQGATDEPLKAGHRLHVVCFHCLLSVFTVFTNHDRQYLQNTVGPTYRI